MRPCNVRRVLPVLLGLALSACAVEREAVGSPSARFSTADFATLRWLEGTWRGSDTVGASFFEGYRFAGDTLIRIVHYADSTQTRVADSGSVYLSGGAIYHEAGATVWRATQLDSAGIHFTTTQNAGTTSSWTRFNRDSWLATLRTSLGGVTTYRLTRTGR